MKRSRRLLQSDKKKRAKHVRQNDARKRSPKPAGPRPIVFSSSNGDVDVDDDDDETRTERERERERFVAMKSRRRRQKISSPCAFVSFPISLIPSIRHRRHYFYTSKYKSLICSIQIEYTQNVCVCICSFTPSSCVGNDDEAHPSRLINAKKRQFHFLMEGCFDWPFPPSETESTFLPIILFIAIFFFFFFFFFDVFKSGRESLE